MSYELRMISDEWKWEVGSGKRLDFGLWIMDFRFWIMAHILLLTAYSL